MRVEPGLAASPGGRYMLDVARKTYEARRLLKFRTLPTVNFYITVKSNTAYRLALGLALTAAFLIVWMNAAAGLIGIEDDDPANLLYGGVLAIGFIGSIIARFRPRGMARALLATAIAQALVGALALRLPNTAGPTQIVVLHSLFVALFVGAALLFRFAAEKSEAPI